MLLLVNDTASNREVLRLFADYLQELPRLRDGVCHRHAPQRRASSRGFGPGLSYGATSE